MEHYSERLLLFLVLFFIRISIFLPFIFLRVLRVPGSHLVLGVWVETNIKYYENISDGNIYISGRESSRGPEYPEVRGPGRLPTSPTFSAPPAWLR